MELRILAAILLLGRLVALYFIVSVIKRQYKLFRAKDDIGTLRKVMFGLSLAMLGMQLIPIIVDVVGIIAPNLKASAVPRPLGIAYTFSNMIFSIVASIMLWLIYEVIDRENILLSRKNAQLEDDKVHLQDDKDHLTEDLAKEKRKH